MIVNVSVQVPGYKDQIEGLIAKFSGEFVKDLFNNLVDATPVDTGRAAASWQILREGEPARILPPGDYARPATPSVTFITKGEDARIVNSAHYVLYLNEGSSDQAPAGFVEEAIDDTIRAYR